MANLQDVMLQELRAGIKILQSQDNHILNEATDLFNGMRQELDTQSKRILDNSLQILAVKITTHTVQKGLSVLTNQIDEFNTAKAAITTLLKSIPSIRELQLHAQTMAEQMAQVAKVNTGLTTAMVGYKFSQSKPFDFRQTTVAEGPSGTLYIHSQRQVPFDQKSQSVSSHRDTETEYSWHARIRGGAGSNVAAGGADGRPTGGEDGGAGGGADSGASGKADGGGAGRAGGRGPPPPPDPPPSDHGGACGRCMFQW